MALDATEKRYLELLSRMFPSANKASAEIINLNAVLNLPKGAEFYASDIHGEFEAFSHILRNASGFIRERIDEVFADSLTDEEKRSLATLVYYPRKRMDFVLPRVENEQQWFSKALSYLVALCGSYASGYTRSHVRKALPEDFAYIIEELLAENSSGKDKEAYCAGIAEAAVRTGRMRSFIEALCWLVQRLAVDRLHIVGDVYDRGPYPQNIMETLIKHPSVDIQWGNHDVVWMGASLGQRGCIAHVVRNCARYGNLSILEDAYGINILPLASFALEVYRDDPCVAFGLKGNPGLSPQELEMNVKIQKAMAIIQFKVEAKLIDDNPSFGLEDRKLLHKIDFEKNTVQVDGIEYELTDTVFPTVDPADPYRLTPEEEEVMQRLEQAFLGSEKLQRHMRFFLEAGSLYKVCNNMLLFHACVPLNADGTLKEVDVYGTSYKGRALYDVMERYVREAFFGKDPEQRKRGRDLMWYLWLGQGSPLFAKSKMATFELYLIADKAARKEVKNPFYSLMDDESVFDAVFEDFGLDPKVSHIVCGHVPVKVKDGEDPVKCGGKVLCIDGGFSRAYQPTTGIAGFTLVSDSRELVLASHEPLESTEAAVVDEVDIESKLRVIDRFANRKAVSDTDTGADIKRRIADLERLLDAYHAGEIAERR